MSNPFTAFRRYQQTLLVIFGIMLMIAWTVGGRLSRYNAARSRAEVGKETAVSWKDGQLSQATLQQIRRYRQIALPVRPSSAQGLDG